MSLQLKITSIFILISIIPLVLVGFLFFSSAERSLSDKITSELGSSVKGKGNDIIDTLTGRVQRRTESIRDNKQIPTLISEIAIKKEDDDSAKEKIEQILREVKGTSGSIKDMQIVNNEYMVIASIDQASIGSKQQPKKFVPLEEGGAITFQMDLIKDSSGKLLLLAWDPINSSDGQVIGESIVVWDFLDLFGNVLSIDELGETGEVVLGQKNHDGNVFMLSPTRFDKDAALRIIDKNSLQIPLLQAFSQDEKIIPRARDYRNHEVIAATYYLKDLSWAVVVKMDYKEAFAAVELLRNRLILIATTSLLFVLAVAFFLSKSIVKPLNRLMETTNRIAQGNLSEQVDIKRSDELGQLAASFNKMTDRVQESYDLLDSKVKERTKQLAQYVKQIEQKNKDLENSKKAILNVLEDEKELEEQLKKEKEGVEKKVQERTRELAEAKAQDEAILSGIGDGVFATDALGKIILFNNAASIISGFDAKEIVGSSYEKVLQFQLEKDGTRHDDFIKKALQGNKASIANHTVLIGKDGRKIPVADSAAPIFDAEGVIKGAVVVFRDVTQERELDRMRDEFFSIASHELRTPLTAIRGNTSLIKQYYGEQLKDPNFRDMVDDIHDSSVRLIEIVNDFLDTSRLEMGRIEFKKESFDLVQLIKDALREYQVTGSRRKLYLNFEKPKITKLDVLADKDRVRQILVNLVGNGLKFTEQGGITIKAESIGEFVKVYVSDTGMGISSENQNLLFKKFQQAEENIITRDVTRGTGLGLYISKLLVEGMGGEIKLEKSEIGKGTTFSFTLPIAKKI